MEQRPAGGEHRIDDDHRPAGERLRQLVDVGLGSERLLVTADPDEPDVGVRQQLLGGVHEAETGAQDRHDHGLHGEPSGRRLGERRGDRRVHRREVLRRPHQQQAADALEVLAEEGVRRRDVADPGKGVGHHGVLDNGDGDAHCAPSACSAVSRA